MAAPTTTPLEKFDSADLRLPSAKDEARALFGLVERGSSSVEAVRKLIEVSPADEQRLRRIAEIEPEVAHCVLPVLRFRKRVLREFERMVANSFVRLHLEHPVAREIMKSDSVAAGNEQRARCTGGEAKANSEEGAGYAATAYCKIAAINVSFRQTLTTTEPGKGKPCHLLP